MLELPAFPRPQDKRPSGFPKSKHSLWDHTSSGQPVFLHIGYYRKPKICVPEKILRLVQHQCEHYGQVNHRLIGTLLVEDDGEGIQFQVDRLDTRPSNPTDGSVLAPEDLLIPLEVNNNTAEGRLASVEDYACAIKHLQDRCFSKDSIDVSGFLLLRGWGSCYSNADTCLVHLLFDLVTVETVFKAQVITPLPIVLTALSKNLAGPRSLSQMQGAPKSGYLTMDHSRKLLLILESDPKTATLPVVGIWVCGVHFIQHPYVWASCLRYIYSTHLQQRVCTPPEEFLVVLYSPLHCQPKFYQCGTVLGNSSLKFQLCSGQEITNMTKALSSQHNSFTQVEMEPVSDGDKMELFEAARARHDLSRAQVDLIKGWTSGQEDLEPRSVPTPHMENVPIFHPVVPDVSVVWTEAPVNFSPPTCTLFPYSQAMPFNSDIITSSCAKSVNSVKIFYPDQTHTLLEEGHTPSVRLPFTYPHPSVDHAYQGPSGHCLQSHTGTLVVPAIKRPLIIPNQNGPRQSSHMFNSNSQMTSYVQLPDPPICRPSIMITPPFIKEPQRPNSALLHPSHVVHQISKMSEETKDNQQVVAQPTSQEHVKAPQPLSLLPAGTLGPAASQASSVEPLDHFFIRPKLALSQNNIPVTCLQTVTQEPSFSERSTSVVSGNSGQSRKNRSLPAWPAPGLGDKITKKDTCHINNSQSNNEENEDRRKPSSCGQANVDINSLVAFQPHLDPITWKQIPPEFQTVLIWQNEQLKQLQEQIQVLLLNQSQQSSHSSLVNNNVKPSPKRSVAVNTTMLQEGHFSSTSVQTSPVKPRKVQEIMMFPGGNDARPQGELTVTSDLSSKAIDHQFVNAQQRGLLEALADVTGHEPTIVSELKMDISSATERSQIDQSSTYVTDCFDNPQDDFNSTVAEDATDPKQFYDQLMCILILKGRSHHSSGKNNVQMFMTNDGSSGECEPSYAAVSSQCAESVNGSCVPKLNYVSMILGCGTDTGQSMEINAMAMKYLNDEQLTQIARLRQTPSYSAKILQHVFTKQTLSPSTLYTPDVSYLEILPCDMTTGTQDYLEKHGLLNNNVSCDMSMCDQMLRLKTDFSLMIADAMKADTAVMPAIEGKGPIISHVSKKDSLYDGNWHSDHSKNAGVLRDLGATPVLQTPKRYPAPLNGNHNSAQDRLEVGEHKRNVQQDGRVWRQRGQDLTSATANSQEDEDENILDIGMLKQMPKLL